MNEVPVGENSIELLDGQCKDLWRIKGIGKEWARRLKNEGGINTVQDLATLSDAQAKVVDDIIDGVSLRMLKGWRSEAIERLPKQRVTKQGNPNPKFEANSPATQDGWESLATFVVVFQGREMEDGTSQQRIDIVHKTGDNSNAWSSEEEGWPGTESEQFWEWMVEQLGETPRQVPAAEEPPGETQSTESGPAAVPPAAIRFTELRIWQPAKSETPRSVAKAGEMFRGWLDGGEPFTIEASFDLAEATAPGVVQAQGPYKVEFSIRNRATGESKSLGETKPANLAENEPPYSAKLSGVRLPTGYYRLLVMVRFQGPPPSQSHLVVPLLQAM